MMIVWLAGSVFSKGVCKAGDASYECFVLYDYLSTCASCNGLTAAFKMSGFVWALS